MNGQPATAPPVQPPMPADARRGGLEVLRAVLRRNHPGFDAVFETVEATHDDVYSEAKRDNRV